MVLLLSSFALPGNAFAQGDPDNCIPCSACDAFELWRFMCPFISQICTIQSLPTEFCEEQRAQCDKNIDDLIAECREICDANCDDTETCPDGTCATGENCPADAADCEDRMCFEPTCEDGCSEAPVSSGSTDEACNDDEGCSASSCSCDGQGNCVASDDCHTHENPSWLDNNDYDILVIEEGCTGIYGTEYLIELREKSTPETEEHCGERFWVWLEAGTTPLDTGLCYRVVINKDSDPGCGFIITHIGSETTCSECESTTPDCHTHEDPEWIADTHILRIIDPGCTAENGCTETSDGISTEYFVEVKDDDHCGEHLWLWVDGTMTPNEPEIGKCYNSFIMKYTGDCNAYVIRYLTSEVDCPECEPTTTDCPDGTCATGENCPADAGTCPDNVCMTPTCEDGCGQVPVTNAEDPGQCDETETPACPMPPCICNVNGECVRVEEEGCRIDLSFNKDEFCPDDNIAITLEFLEAGTHVDYTTLEAILKKSSGSEIDLSDDFTKTDTGIYVTYGGIGSEGERTLEVKSLFGGCEEEATASYTILSKDDDECKDRDDTECSVTSTFDKESYCEEGDITITTEFRSNDILADPTYFGIMVDRIGGSADITERYERESEGVYVFEGTIASASGWRTFWATAYFDDGCHATETQDFFVYSADECPDEPENDCACADITLDGYVNNDDAEIINASMDTCSGDSGYDPRADLTGDDCANSDDILCAVNQWGETDCAGTTNCTQYDCPKLTGEECENEADASACRDAWQAGCITNTDASLCEYEADSDCPDMTCVEITSVHNAILCTYDTNTNSIIDMSEMGSAMDDWKSGDITKDDLCPVISAWKFGSSCTFDCDTSTSCPADFKCKTLTQVLACHENISADNVWTAEECENLQVCADEWELSHDIECPADRLVGDIDGDDLITTDDSTIGALIVVGYLNPPSDLCCVDTSNDDSFDISDVQRIEQYIAGNTTCFPRGYTCSAPENCDDTIDNNCNGEVNEGCDSTACTDTDTGKDYYEKGTVECSGKSFEDRCKRSSITNDESGLVEFYCQSGRSNHINVKCTDGCVDGACQGAALSPTCTDTDGDNIYTKGSAKDEYGTGQNDCCVASSAGGSCVTEGSHVREGLCKADPDVGVWTFTNRIFDCPNGCVDGACTGEAPKADLLVTDISWSPTNPTGDYTGTVHTYVSIENIGTADAKDFKINLNINGYNMWTAPLDLAAGEKMTRRTVGYKIGLHQGFNVGSNTLKAKVDSGDIVDESNEDNNDRAENLTIPEEICGLPGTSLDTQSECESAGCSWLTGTHGCGSDIGDCGYEPHDYECSIKSAWSEMWPGAVSECYNCDCNWCCCPTFEEAPKADLRVTDISWAPTNPTGDHTGWVYTYVTIENIGEGDANDFKINLNTNGYDMWTAPLNLAAGNSLTRRTVGYKVGPREGFKVGSNTLKAKVDSDDTVEESDEFNNERTETLTIPEHVCDLPGTSLDTESECESAGCSWLTGTHGCGSDIGDCGYEPQDYECSIKSSGSRYWLGAHSECANCDCSWCCCPAIENETDSDKRTPPCDSYGDIDNDGYITKRDVDLLFDIIDKDPTDEQERKGDVNGNGGLDFDDIAKVSSYLEGKIDTFPVCDSIPSKPDLIISELSLTTTKVGETAKIRAVVKNIGNADASGQLKTELYLKEGTKSLITYGQAAPQTIAPDQSITIISTPSWNVAPGTYALSAETDVYKGIEESNENNNGRAETLRITNEICTDGIDNDGDGNIDCKDPDCGGQTGSDGVICCHSDSDCDSFTLPEDECLGPIVLKTYIKVCNSKYICAAWYSGSICDDGNHGSCKSYECGGSASYCTNDGSSWEWRRCPNGCEDGACIEANAKPDLTVIDIKLLDVSGNEVITPIVGTEYTFASTIKNIGNADLDKSYQVRFSDNGDVSNTIKIYTGSPLKADESQTVTYTYTFSNAKTYSIIFFVDDMPDDTTESDETNNMETESFTVTEPCTITSAKITPWCNGDACEAGESIEFEVSYKNCPALLPFIQIDAQSTSPDNDCSIEYWGADMSGIYKTESGAKGMWTIPTIPDKCKGKIIEPTLVGLYDGGHPGIGDGLAWSKDISGMFELTSSGETGYDGIISGKVVDENGNPISGANVETIQCPGASCKTCAKVQTDANGVYTMTDLSTGSYIVKASMSGYDLTDQTAGCTSAEKNIYGEGIVCLGMGTGNCGSTTAQKTANFVLSEAVRKPDWISTSVTSTSNQPNKVYVGVSYGYKGGDKAKFKLYKRVGATGTWTVKFTTTTETTGVSVSDYDASVVGTTYYYYAIAIKDGVESEPTETKSITLSWPVCSDDDYDTEHRMGINFYKKGIHKGKIDECVDSTRLHEYFCSASDSTFSTYYNCPNGCSDGACINDEKVCTLSGYEWTDARRSETPCNDYCTSLGYSGGEIIIDGSKTCSGATCAYISDFSTCTQSSASNDGHCSCKGKFTCKCI